MSSRTKRLLATYVGLVITLLGALAWLLMGGSRSLLAAALGKLLPDGWVVAVVHLVEWYVTNHLPAVLTFLVTWSAAVVPALVFWLKEMVSVSYERDLVGERHHPSLPLARQLLDEVIMLVMVAALSLLALRLSVSPGLKWAGVALGQLVLLVTVAVDFVGPTLARPGRSPVGVWKMLVRYPVRTLLFGLAISLPLTLGAGLASWLGLSGAILFILLHGVMLGAAVIVGTRVAVGMEDGDDATPATNLVVVALALALLVFNGLYFGGLLKALYNISPVLQSKWDYVEGTLEYGHDSGATLYLSFDVTVHNPTGRTAALQDEHDVQLRHGGDNVASMRLPPFEVAPGATVVRSIKFKLSGRSGLIDKGVRFVESASKGGFRAALKRASKSAANVDAYAADLVLPLPTGELLVPLYRGDES